MSRKKPNHYVQVAFNLEHDPQKVSEELTLRRATLVAELFGSARITHTSNGDLRIGNRGSLSLRPDGRWYSFESEEHGNLIGLVMKIKEYGFPDAMRWSVDFIHRNPLNKDTISPVQRIGAGWSPQDSQKLAKKLWKEAEKHEK